jgi:TadE-like protein
MRTLRLLRDERGGVLVETTVMIAIVLVFVLGAIDFLFAFYQWNAAAKAVEIGARIAAVSNPLATGLSCITATCATSDSLSTRVVASPCDPAAHNCLGDAMPSFTITCNDGGSGSCACTSGTCTGVSGYNLDALDTIVKGRGSTACGDATSVYHAGMCDIFPRIQRENVKITYTQPATGGLGYRGRNRGPVPTITVSIQSLTFEFYFLGGLLGFGNINMPGLQTTITGEDLSSSAPS